MGEAVAQMPNAVRHLVHGDTVLVEPEEWQFFDCEVKTRNDGKDEKSLATNQYALQTAWTRYQVSAAAPKRFET
eukprot:SAG31_NODE_43381_length_267_cov_0.875000_1_plen_73_part_01